MTGALSLLLWISAFTIHGLTSGKMRRLLGLEDYAPSSANRLLTILLPVAALILCLKQAGWPGFVYWYATASIAGILMAGALTVASARHTAHRRAARHATRVS